MDQDHLAVGGSAIAKACDKIIEKGKKVAAHMLEGKPEDIDFKDGEFILKNSNKKKTIGEIAFACYCLVNLEMLNLHFLKE